MFLIKFLLLLLFHTVTSRDAVLMAILFCCCNLQSCYNNDVYVQGGLKKVSLLIFAITLSTASQFHNFWHIHYRKFVSCQIVFLQGHFIFTCLDTFAVECIV